MKFKHSNEIAMLTCFCLKEYTSVIWSANKSMTFHFLQDFILKRNYLNLCWLITCSFSHVSTVLVITLSVCNQFYFWIAHLKRTTILHLSVVSNIQNRLFIVEKNKVQKHSVRAKFERIYHCKPQQVEAMHQTFVKLG